jgi:hypothetical protein
MSEEIKKATVSSDQSVSEPTFESGYDIESQNPPEAKTDGFDQEAVKRNAESVLADDSGAVSYFEVLAYINGAHWQFDRDQSELTSLRAEVERLRGALMFYADKDNWLEPDPGCPYWTLWDDGNPTYWQKASQALGEGK